MDASIATLGLLSLSLSLDSWIIMDMCVLLRVLLWWHGMACGGHVLGFHWNSIRLALEKDATLVGNHLLWFPRGSSMSFHRLLNPVEVEQFDANLTSLIEYYFISTIQALILYLGFLKIDACS